MYCGWKFFSKKKLRYGCAQGRVTLQWSGMNSKWLTHSNGTATLGMVCAIVFTGLGMVDHSLVYVCFLLGQQTPMGYSM